MTEDKNSQDSELTEKTETIEETAEEPQEEVKTEEENTPSENSASDDSEKSEPEEEENEYEALLKETSAEKEGEKETVGPAAAVDSEEEEEEPAKTEEKGEEQDTHIFALRTTANREDQVLAFVSANAAQKKLPVYSVIGPHGMRGYIFVEAADRISAEQAATGVPYSKGLLPSEVQYSEIEHMLEQVKKEINIQKNDIVEIISGPFKREQAKISRVDKTKEEVVVELLEAAVPIPITLKTDDVKVIRREDE